MEPEEVDEDPEFVPGWSEARLGTPALQLVSEGLSAGDDSDHARGVGVGSPCTRQCHTWWH